MHIDKQLIEKYFRRECKPEEAELVSSYLKANKEVLDEYLNEAEWLAFQDIKQLPQNVSDRIYHKIEQATNYPVAVVKIKATRRITKFISIAATVLLVFSILFVVYKQTQTKKQSNEVAAKMVISKEHLTLVRNETHSKKEFILEDGSLITLYPNSELKYYQPFKSNSRDLYLKGKAFFKVAKDKNRPFTVDAANLSTTALGTQFVISAFDNDPRKTIKLLEGKVVIKPNKNLIAKGVKTVYLTPGEQLNLNTTSYIANVSSFRKPKPVETIKIPKPKQIITLMFEDEPLHSVITKLENAYLVKIDYKTGDLSDLYFTGTFNQQQDSIHQVLNIITSLNNLHLSTTNNGYLITKN